MHKHLYAQHANIGYLYKGLEYGGFLVSMGRDPGTNLPWSLRDS